MPSPWALRYSSRTKAFSTARWSPSVIGVASEAKKRISTSSGSAPALTWAPADDLPERTAGRRAAAGGVGDLDGVGAGAGPYVGPGRRPTREHVVAHDAGVGGPEVPYVYAGSKER